ncbi:MAG: hypothetical protein KF718_16875 [Polyangiaceae bacterium]|nr:hypothetical protein [Polyangiaceae bacterium]
MSASNLANAQWQGEKPKIITLNSGPGGKVGSTAFEQLAAQYASSHGSPLRGALAAGKVDPNTSEPVVLGAFSAGWGLVEAILRVPEDRARVRAVGAFDAYYTGPGKGRKPGYSAFAELAANGQKAMVMTSSHIAGPTYPSSAASTDALMQPIGLGPIPLRSVPPAECELAAGRGALRWYVYKNRSTGAASHSQHATVLAPAFLPELVHGQIGTGGGADMLVVGLGAYVAGVELGWW